VNFFAIVAIAKHESKGIRRKIWVEMREGKWKKTRHEAAALYPLGSRNVVRFGKDVGFRGAVAGYRGSFG